MLLLLGVLGGLVAGQASGGRLGNLGRIRWRWPGVLLLALVTRGVGLATTSWLAAVAGTPGFPLWFLLATGILTGWTAWHSRMASGFWLVSLGAGLNLLAILANGGHMPVSPALAALVPPELTPQHPLGQYVMGGPSVRLIPLGDSISLPGTAGTPLEGAYSPGDLVTLAGLALAAFQLTRSDPPPSS